MKVCANGHFNTSSIQNLRKRLIHAKFWHQPADAASPLLAGDPTPRESGPDGEQRYWRVLTELRGAIDSRLRSQQGVAAPGEELPAFWDVQGTTGYDFLNAVNALFCRKDAAKAMLKTYRAFIRWQGSYEDLVAAQKRLIISKHLAGNVDNLAHHLKRISSRDRYGRDVTLYGLEWINPHPEKRIGAVRVEALRSGGDCSPVVVAVTAVRSTGD